MGYCPTLWRQTKTLVKGVILTLWNLIIYQREVNDGLGEIEGDKQPHFWSCKSFMIVILSCRRVTQKAELPCSLPFLSITISTVVFFTATSTSELIHQSWQHSNPSRFWAPLKHSTVSSCSYSRCRRPPQLHRPSSICTMRYLSLSVDILLKMPNTIEPRLWLSTVEFPAQEPSPHN